MGMSTPSMPDTSGAASGRNARVLRLPLLALATVAMLAGLWGGLDRPGWSGHAPELALRHGPLLVSGLFGALVGLERAMALREPWVYASPVLAGLGTLALLLGLPTPAGAIAYTGAAAVLSGASLLIALRQPALFTGALLFGAMAWFAGNLSWALGSSLPEVVGWWLSFLVLTVAAQRMEISRVLVPRRGSEAMFLFAMALLLAGARNGIMASDGAMLFGLALLLTTAWLATHDIARFTIRRTGPARYMAVAMLGGYAWLAVAGLGLVLAHPAAVPFGEAAALHAILVGFVLSTLFGQSLVILPATIGLRISVSRWFYLPLALLHVACGLALAGEFAQLTWPRLASGPLALLAIACLASLICRFGRGGRIRAAGPAGTSASSAGS